MSKKEIDKKLSKALYITTDTKVKNDEYTPTMEEINNILNVYTKVVSRAMKKTFDSKVFHILLPISDEFYNYIINALKFSKGLNYMNSKCVEFPNEGMSLICLTLEDTTKYVNDFITALTRTQEDLAKDLHQITETIQSMNEFKTDLDI